jgi:tRNA(adenine34) deaminase
MNLLEDPRFNHQPAVSPGLLADECGALLSSFFKRVRQEGKPPGDDRRGEDGLLEDDGRCPAE